MAVKRDLAVRHSTLNRKAQNGVSPLGAYASNDPLRPTWTYVAFDHAFEVFNAQLFGGLLPPCLITLQRKRGVRSYFAPACFSEVKQAANVVDEIALNPTYFGDQTIPEILSAVIHEAVHLWQHYFGKPGCGRYHNREWAAKMEAIGLMPSDTGLPHGKRTGYDISHYIIEGARFEAVCAAYLATYPTLMFQDRALKPRAEAESDIRERLRKRASKTRYICPACGFHAWALPNAGLQHVMCQQLMEAK